MPELVVCGEGGVKVELRCAYSTLLAGTKRVKVDCDPEVSFPVFPQHDELRRDFDEHNVGSVGHHGTPFRLAPGVGAVGESNPHRAYGAHRVRIGCAWAHRIGTRETAIGAPRRTLCGHSSFRRMPESSFIRS